MKNVEAPGSDVEAMLAILREHELRGETAITPELREHLGCAQTQLESGFVEATPFLYQVFVRRIDLDPQPLTEPSQGIVKFSPRSFSPATYDSVRLGTAQYYREYEGEGFGIQDQDEAVYKESLQSYFGKYNPEAVPMLGPWSATFTVGQRTLTCEIAVSGAVTYQMNDSWLYCTARQPQSRSERALMQSQFDGDGMTALGKPSEFARELGSAFAQLSPGPKVSRDEFHQLQHNTLLSQTPIKRIVYVNHGPVIYTDDAESLIEAVPQLYRASAVPFVKSINYADQREYRFAVSTIGTPTEELQKVRITTKLRSLLRIVN